MPSQSPAAASPSFESEAYGARTGYRTLALLCAGHFLIDLYTTSLASLQPLLVDKLRLSLSQAGLLGGLMILFNSVMQPVYGIVSDRMRMPAFAAAAPAIAAIFLSAIGLAPSYATLLALVAVGGSAVAAFHPQGTALSGCALAHNRGRAMALFISTGTLGGAVGPAYFSEFVRRAGLPGTVWAAVPGVLLSVALICLLPKAPERALSQARRTVDWSELKAVRKPLLVLYFLVFIRSAVAGTYSQFLPLYLNRERGMGLTEANWVLSAYLFFGALGGFIGGQLADRFGGRRIILVSMIGSVPLLALFFTASGWLALAGLTLGGLVLLFTIPVNVVMAQELAPGQAGTVSALLMGFAWGMAGLIFIPLTGWIADHIGMRVALASLTALPLAGFALATMLPKDARA